MHKLIFEKLKDTEGFRLRISDWRVIADIDNKIITVLKVRHRKNVYNK